MSRYRSKQKKSRSSSYQQKPSYSPTKFLLVLTTAGSVAEAKKLARFALVQKLAACVNIIPFIQSWYWWQDKVSHGKEILLIFKTSGRHLHHLAQLLKLHHSYKVPELLAVPISWGDRVYLDWLVRSIKKS